MMNAMSLPFPQRALGVLAVLAAVAVAACGGDTSREARSNPAAGVVDSALPIPVLLSRFRESVPETLNVLVGGESSPGALARALLRALSTNDTATVRDLAVSRAEFAWLYYQHSKFTAPPYVLPPDLVWMTMVAASDKGAGRLLARYGGRKLQLDRLGCPDSAAVEGPNEILRGCRVRFAVPDSAPRELQLFGALLKRDGRYKFLSYANDL